MPSSSPSISTAPTSAASSWTGAAQPTCSSSLRLRPWGSRATNYNRVGHAIEALVQIELTISFGTGAHARTEDIIFDVVDNPYPNNSIFGRCLLNASYIVLHPGFLCMKMPGSKGTIKVLGDQEHRGGKGARPTSINELAANAGTPPSSPPPPTSSQRPPRREKSALSHFWMGSPCETYRSRRISPWSWK